MSSLRFFLLDHFFKTCPKTGRIVSVRRRNAFGLVLFPFIGILALCWFALRVLPKPSRAAYPCQRVAAPLASTFIAWIVAIFFSSIAFRGAKAALKRSRYVIAGCCAIAAIAAIFIGSISTADPAGAQTASALQPITSPIGTARGTVPGRVVWAWDPAATNENCTDIYPDLYYLDANTNPIVVEQMVSKSLQQLTNTASDTAAWDAIFKYYNATKRNLPNTGYQSGEKIFIKLNLCSAFGMNKADGYTKLPNYSYPGAYPCDMRGMPDVSPQMVRAMLKELTTVAGVPQQNIYIGDPTRPFFEQLFSAIQPSYPNVHYVDRWALPGLGRELLVPTSQPAVFYSDHFGGTSGTYDPALVDSLPQQLVDATYLIDMAVLKAHESAGITLCAKNFYGSTCRTTVANPDQGSAWAFHHSLPDYNKPGYGNYRNLVDFMGHKDLGGKTILCVVDGLWGGHNSTPIMPNKWKSSPFNNDWPSSILMSQDMVATDAVGFDFLRTEYSTDYGYGSDYLWPNATNGVDDYLFQAASSAYWPTTDANGQPFRGYDPENDGTVIGSLGVYEHWNNATDKQYTRNINPAAPNGIELVKILPQSTLILLPVSGATASSALQTASLAIDGNTATRWESTQGVDPQWIMFDLGSAQSVSVLVIDWEAANAKNYTVEGSNDATFATKQTLATETNMPAGQHRIDSLTGLTGSYRYYRIYGTARNLTYGYSIWETRFYSGNAPATYSITASAGANGSIGPSGSIIVNQGASQTFTITPNSGYTIDAVTVDGAATGAPPSYTFTNVTASHTISATFKPTTTQYTVTATAGANGSISPSGSVLVNSGASQTFAITPNSGYQVDVVTVDGASQGSITSYTFTNVTANHAIGATFKSSTTQTPFNGPHNITNNATLQAEDFDNGGEGVAYHDNEAANQGGQYRPSEGVDVEVCGAGGYDVGWTAAGEWMEYTCNVTAGTYTVTLYAASANTGAYTAKLYQDNVLKATFTVTGTGGWQTWKPVTVSGIALSGGSASVLKLESTTGGYNLDKLTFTSGVTQYTVTATAGANGSISPSGSVLVNSGASQTFAITPNSGYQVDVVTVDGASQGSITSYTFTNVTANHAIGATFKSSTTQTPFNGPHNITNNATLQAEDFDNGGEGVAYHDNEAANQGGQYRPSEGVDVEVCGAGGYDVGWTAAGEWMEYTCNVTAGTYTVTLYAASANTGAYTAKLYQDNVLKATFTVTGTGGWQTWKPVTVSGIALSGGSASVLKLESTTGGYNLDKLTFTSGVTQYTVAATAGANGSISPSGSVLVNSGASQTFAITPNSGYQVDVVTVDGASQGAITSYTFTNVTANHAIGATFKSATATYTLTVSYVNGTVSLSPAGPTYPSGTAVTMTATPSVGYVFSSWSGAIASTANPVSITMDANKSVTANFTSVGTYVVQASAGANGSISPSGTVPTTIGTARTFAITANSGYTIDQVTVDGAMVGAVAAYTFPSTTTGTHSISVTFKSTTPIKLPIVTASASSTENAQTPASAAIDNNTATRWSSAFSDPQWIVVDLGSAKSISRVRLLWEAASAKNYVVEGSNDASFATKTTLATKTNMASGARTDDLTGLSGSYRYLRMYGSARTTTYGYSLWEFEVYGN